MKKSAVTKNSWKIKRSKHSYTKQCLQLAGLKPCGYWLTSNVTKIGGAK